MCSIAFRCSHRGPNVSSNALEIAWWKRKYRIFVSYVKDYQVIVITAVNSLLTSKGCFIRLFTDVSTQKNYVYLFQNLGLGLILKIFLKFRKFQPRYSYKIYSYKRKRVYMLNAKRRPESRFRVMKFGRDVTVDDGGNCVTFHELNVRIKI